MVNLESAIAFVRKHGTAVEQARLRHILDDERPTQQVVDDLLAAQRADGGWAPFWASDYSSLDATCFRLAQAEQLGVPISETPVRRAIDFLVQRQRADGSWEEDEWVAWVAPPWAQPGEASARLYLTANCGFWVATLGGPDAVAVRAADYLQRHLAQNGRLPSFLHAHWLAAGLWYRVNRGESAQRVLSYLSSRLPGMSANNLTWLLTTLLIAGIPANEALIQAAAARLEEHQSADGHWPSDDGPHHDVHVTLEALRALSAVTLLENPSTRRAQDRLSRIRQIALTVSDVPSALAFYRDVLGLEFLFSAGENLAFLAAGDVRIMLTTPQGAGTPGANSILYFAVSDIGAVHAALLARGAKDERGPALTAKMPDHELWTAFVRDPEGNLVGLMEERR